MRRTIALLALAAATGCMVGPDFTPLRAPVRDAWLDVDAAMVSDRAPEDEAWWTAFGDPTLNRLVETAYAGNRTLRAAGLRVIEAQARRAIAIGQLFPQRQEVSGSYSWSRIGPASLQATTARAAAATAAGTVTGATTPAAATEGRARAGAAGATAGSVAANAWTTRETYALGFDAAWELDFWGRFRRAVESADQALIASVADYDAVLVSLVAEVAATYMNIRTLQERLAIAQDNVRTQEESLRIARVRVEAGGTTELDLQQATALLRDTEASIPQFESQLRQATDALAVLLGQPPDRLDAELGSEPGRLPTIPATVLVGIPAELVRRRPDVQAAEHAAASQSARIGVAVSDLLPSFTLVGSLGLSAADAARFFDGGFAGSVGPSVAWPILNYGRLINAVRVEDATFQELVVSYENTVLQAQQEVEDALAGYVYGTVQVQRLTESVTAANRAVDLSLIQYREGATDYTRVLNSQQSKLREDDLLVSTRGTVARSVVALYKALGGGWQLRGGNDFVPEETKAAMRERTYWGGELDAERRDAEIRKAAADQGPERPAWRWWWPIW